MYDPHFSTFMFMYMFVPLKNKRDSLRANLLKIKAYFEAIFCIFYWLPA